MRIHSFDYFRAVAIFLVVMVHFPEPTVKESYPILWNFISNGTLLFVFISGVLFAVLKNHEMSYKKFLVKKLSYTILPYFVCSLPILTIMFITEKWVYEEALTTTGNLRYFEYLVTGRHLTAYWFIPYAFLLFLMFPIHSLFSKMKTNKQLLLILCWSVISVHIQRPVNLTNPIHSLIYYVPAYWLGVTIGLNRHNLHNYEKFWLIPLLSSILLAIGQFYLSSNQIGEYNNYWLKHNGVDFNFIQKICIVITFSITMHKFNMPDIKILKVVAAYSFPIYFIHPYFKLIFNSVDGYKHFESFNPLLTTLILTITFTLLSGFIAFVIKKVFKKHSRYLIGM